MTTISLFLFGSANGAACSNVYTDNAWQSLANNAGCWCGFGAADSANNCGTATGNSCITNVDGSKTCKLIAKCSTTDGSAAADECECLDSGTALTTSAGANLCGPAGYCYTSSSTSGSHLLSAATCSNLKSDKIPTVVAAGTAGSYVVQQMAKCGTTYCEQGEYCSAANTCTAGTGAIDGITTSGSGGSDTAGGVNDMISANLIGGANTGASSTATKTWCTARVLADKTAPPNTGAPNPWDVITSANTDRCYAPQTTTIGTAQISTGSASKKFIIYGTSVVLSSAYTVATTSACTAFKVNGPNSMCYASGTGSGTANTDVTIYCGGGAYYAGNGITTAVDLSSNTATTIKTYCKAAGELLTTSGNNHLKPLLCNVHDASSTVGGLTVADGCACAPNAGNNLEVQGGERACPKANYCYAQGKDEGQTLQGVNTCMVGAAKQCYQNAGSASADATLTEANMNGTVFTQAHSATTGAGEACFCGDKICGAGRACISANATGWTGVAADGANGASGATKSYQCLSAAIDHCPGANGTVGLDVFSAGRADPWKIDADGTNKACYCDAGETTICGAGRYCLNNTASGFTGSAECLSDVVKHCTNYTGFTSADEACTCSDSLTCGQGQFCVNGTHFTDADKPAECLAAQIAPCVNWTKALGPNTHGCTCGKDVCAAGQSCDSNTTCTSVSTPAPTGGSSAAGYEKPAIAFLTVAAVLFSALY